MELKNEGGMEDDFPFPRGDFQVPAVAFWGVEIFFLRKCSKKLFGIRKKNT